jgi:CBS domain-containing protein
MTELTPRTVSDLMTHTVVAVGPDAPFKKIVETMGQWKVSAVPVLEGDGRVVGVVSEADLLAKEEFRDTRDSLIDQYRRLDELAKAGGVTARELMTAPAVCVQANATSAQAARTMAREKVKRLPVVDGEGRLAGIISRSDLLQVFLRGDEQIAAEVARQVVEPLFPDGAPTLRAEVHEGVVRYTGTLRDATLVPIAARMTRSVEGVVDVEFDLSGSHAARSAARTVTGDAA